MGKKERGKYAIHYYFTAIFHKYKSKKKGFFVDLYFHIHSNKIFLEDTGD